MSLITKYHLLLISVLLTSLIIVGASSYSILHRHAKDEIIKQASVLMDATQEIRKNTTTEFKLFLALQDKQNLSSQPIASNSTRQHSNTIQKSHSEYRYKEATLNPTNPRHQATDWEEDVIQEFRNNANLKDMTLIRETPTGTTLNYARPIRIENQNCLNCHGTVENAPQAMVSLYGPANGFGWKLGEVVGSQIVSLPLSVPEKRANETFVTLSLIISGIFVVLYLMFLFISKKLSIDRVITLTSVDDEVTPDIKESQENKERPLRAHNIADEMPEHSIKYATQNSELPTQNATERVTQKSKTQPEKSVHHTRQSTQTLQQFPIRPAIQASQTQSQSSVQLASAIQDPPSIPEHSAKHTIPEPHTQAEQSADQLKIDPDEISENTILRDLEEFDESSEEFYTTSLQKMYKKHDMEELLLEEGVDIDDIFTGNNTDSTKDQDSS